MGRELFAARDLWGAISYGLGIYGGRDFVAKGVLGRGFFWAIDFGVERCRVREISGAQEYWCEVFLGRWF
jgi:hypothetical protein